METVIFECELVLIINHLWGKDQTFKWDISGLTELDNIIYDLGILVSTIIREEKTMSHQWWKNRFTYHIVILSKNIWVGGSNKVKDI